MYLASQTRSIFSFSEMCGYLVILFSFKKNNNQVHALVEIAGSFNSARLYDPNKTCLVLMRNA